MKKPWKQKAQWQKICASRRKRQATMPLVKNFSICLGKSGETTGLLRLLDVLFTDERKQEEKQKILEDEFQLPMKQQLGMQRTPVSREFLKESLRDS